MVETDWAWLAGLVDGEGCLEYSRLGGPIDRPHYSARLTIAMYSWPAIEKAIGIVASLGLGPPNLYERIGNGGKPRFGLHMAGVKVAAVIRKLLPHLTVKVAEARLLLEALVACPAGRGQYGHGGQMRSPELLALQEGYYLVLKEAKVQAYAPRPN